MLCERTGLSSLLKGFCRRGFLYCMSAMDMIDELAWCVSAFDVKETDFGTPLESQFAVLLVSIHVWFY